MMRPLFLRRSGTLTAFGVVLAAACGGTGGADTSGTDGVGGSSGSSATGGKGGASASGGKGGATSTGGTAGASAGGAAAGGSTTAGAAGTGGSAAGTGGSTAGSAGSSGAGTAGTAGTAGNSGTSGSAGSAGATGGSGTAGSSGASGAAGAGGGCVPKTCIGLGLDCGTTTDGCGNNLQCGNCPMGQTCGGTGKQNVCGVPPCSPKSCTDQAISCGPAGDGCGKQLDCGMCKAGESCGGGGKSGVCGTAPCTAKSCAQQAISCGPAGDGCGNLLDCGTCPIGQSCGGGGTPGACGAPTCTPKACGQAGLECGAAADGCGGLLQCGTCNQPKQCGAGGQVNVCATPSTCTNLCLQQVSCSGGKTTSVSGIVYAPNGVDPLPNAAVYVPNAAVQAFTPGVSCDTCGAPASGSPLVSAVTGIDGKFKLTNVPVGSNIPLVIQIGRWRRQVTIPSVTACVDTPVAAANTHLPKNKSEGDIPLMAFSTGAVDALECVMRKIGVDDAEFTAPTNGGRIHLYEGLTDHNSQNHTASIWASGGAKASGSPTEDQLWTTQAALNKYDMVLFPCQADQADPTLRSAAVHQNLVNYANAGGRVFATHFSYIWLNQTAPFNNAVQWNVEQHPSPANQTGFIDTSFPRGQALAQWLVNVNASTTLGQIPLQVIRHDHDNMVAPTQSWMTIDNDLNFPGATVHFTFNTPMGSPASQQCGRVLFDDFHVENTSFAPTVGAIFPAECAAGAMTAQEKLLEYMIFDLASCVAPDQPPACVTKTCGELGIGCGPAGDGCGGVQQCGSCPGGQTCGGGGTPSQCGAPTCSPKSCVQQNLQCGPAGDGCGNLLQCGTCPMGQSCGGGGMAGVCGTQMCNPKTCVQQGFNCGPAGDGCGNQLNCGNCPSGQTCGGGGTPGMCGAPPCPPKTCVDQGIECGPAGDGCGLQIQCGNCVVPKTCGGSGVPGVCGGNGKP